MGKLGAGTSVGIAPESTWGTAVTPTHFRAPIAVDVSRQYENAATGRIGTSFFSGDVESFETAEVSGLRFDVTYENFGEWLEMALWSTVSTAGPSGTQYTHTFNVGTAAPIGHTMQVIQGDTGNSLDMEGALVSSVEFAVSVGTPYLTMTLALIGETVTVNGSPTSASYGSGDENVSAIDGADLSWDSATYCLRTLRVVLNNGIERRNCIGSATTEKPLQTRERTVLVEFEVDHDPTLETKHAARTEANATIVFTGSGDNVWTFTLRNMEIQTLSEPINNQGVITQRITARCRENPVGTYPLQIEVKNANSSGTAN
jgi:hypothetical protein